MTKDELSLIKKLSIRIVNINAQNPMVHFDLQIYEGWNHGLRRKRQRKYLIFLKRQWFLQNET